MCCLRLIVRLSVFHNSQRQHWLIAGPYPVAINSFDSGTATCLVLTTVSGRASAEDLRHQLARHLPVRRSRWLGLRHSTAAGGRVEADPGTEREFAMPTDENPFFSPTHRTAPPPKRPRERLFEFVRADDLPMACVLFNNGECGWEAQILERGELFDAKGGSQTRDDAIAWANGERQALEG
jgi:hypothetical protein